ncbi:hypothetical protein N7540_000122 [Penicillium herquei]|nr:hypothetical protein N7540_000122 [Penicillium herquei]
MAKCYVQRTACSVKSAANNDAKTASGSVNRWRPGQHLTDLSPVSFAQGKLEVSLAVRLANLGAGARQIKARSYSVTLGERVCALTVHPWRHLTRRSPGSHPVYSALTLPRSRDCKAALTLNSPGTYSNK